MEIEHKSSASDSSRVEARCAEHPEQIAVGTCGRCGNYYCQACRGRSEDGRDYCKACDASRAYVAWEDGSLDFWDRYYRTVRSSILQLPRFAGELPSQGNLARALSFALFPTAVAAVLGSAVMAAVLGWVVTNIPDSTATTAPGALLMGGLMFVMYVAMALFGYLGYLFVWPLLLVGVARLLGRRELSYPGALRCLCYASGLNWLYVIPLVGMFAGVYHFVVAAFCIGAMSRSSALTGFAIYGLPTMVCGLGSCGAYFALIMATVGRT